MNVTFRPPARPALLLLCATALLFAGCEDQAKSVTAQTITPATTCALDGMVLQDFPGPKAQLHYAGQPPEFLCDTREMFALVLRPEQSRPIVGIFTQDMAKTDWLKPDGYWIDARTAFYVLGSSRHGSMGPTVASFGSAADAQRFAGQYGGKVLRFAEVTLDMVDLSGGGHHDEKM